MKEKIAHVSNKNNGFFYRINFSDFFYCFIKKDRASKKNMNQKYFSMNDGNYNCICNSIVACRMVYALAVNAASFSALYL